MGEVPVGGRLVKKPNGWFFNLNHVIAHCIRAVLELVRKKRANPARVDIFSACKTT